MIIKSVIDKLPGVIGSTSSILLCPFQHRRAHHASWSEALNISTPVNVQELDHNNHFSQIVLIYIIICRI